MVTIDRTGRQPVAHSDLADATGRDDRCTTMRRQRRQRNGDRSTVAVAGIGGVMMLCCAGPALLSTGLLTIGAGVVFGAGAIGTVGVVAVLVGLRRIRRLRVDTAAHRRTPPNLFGPSVVAANSSDDSDRSRDKC